MSNNHHVVVQIGTTTHTWFRSNAEINNTSGVLVIRNDTKVLSAAYAAGHWDAMYILTSEDFERMKEGGFNIDSDPFYMGEVGEHPLTVPLGTWENLLSNNSDE